MTQPALLRNQGLEPASDFAQNGEQRLAVTNEHHQRFKVNGGDQLSRQFTGR